MNRACQSLITQTSTRQECLRKTDFFFSPPKESGLPFFITWTPHTFQRICGYEGHTSI